MKRRTILVAGAAGALAGLTGPAAAQAPASCAGDGTPRQFMPKTAADPDPLANELSKYPKCPYCGMDRTEFHFSRHLVHYADDLVDGTCSLHCAAVSLSLNLDRGPKAIYGADYGAAATPKPLVEVGQAVYLLGGAPRPVMSGRAKTAFAKRAAAEAEQAKGGGEIVDFDAALHAAYTDMAIDTAMIRKRREEKRRRAMDGKG